MYRHTDIYRHIYFLNFIHFFYLYLLWLDILFAVLKRGFLLLYYFYNSFII